VRILAATVAVLAALAELVLAGYLAVICLPLIMREGSGLAGGVATIVLFGPVPALATLGVLHIAAVVAVRRGWPGGYLAIALCLIGSTVLASQILPFAFRVWAAPVLILAAGSALLTWLNGRRQGQVTG
jgi:hypothetical protein